MVSIRQMELDGSMPTMPCNEIDWTAIRRSMQYSLRSSGISDDECEELADQALCETYSACQGFVSQQRCRMESRQRLSAIRKAAIEERSVSTLLCDLDLANIVTDERISRLSPLRSETTEAMEMLRERRATERLFRRFAWLVPTPESIPEKRERQTVLRKYRQSLLPPVEPGDTWQPIERWRDSIRVCSPSLRSVRVSDGLLGDISTVEIADGFAIAERIHATIDNSGTDYIPGI